MPAPESDNIPPFLENVLIIKHFFEWSRGAAFLFAVSGSFYLKKQVNEEVIEYSRGKGKVIGKIELDTNQDNGFLTQLRLAKEQYPGGLILNNIDALLRETEGAFVSDFNLMREGLIALKTPLLIWLDKQNHELFTHKAFDLYLRRELSTLFFEDPVIPNDESAIERFTEATRESAGFEETRMRISLLEQQLNEARVDELSRQRLANEIVLPLIQAYVDNSMLFDAKKLLSEFEADFDYKKANADTTIGKLFEKTGDLELAIVHYEKALQNNLRLFGEENNNAAAYYKHLGLAWKYKGDLGRAIEYLEKALRIDLKLFGEESPSVATIYNHIGMAWEEEGNLEKAIECLEKALKIDLKLFGEENYEVATDYNSLGKLWQDKGNLDKCIEYYEKGLKIDLKLFGENSENVAIDYNDLGLVFKAKGDFDKAIKYYEKALRIYIKLLGDNNPNIAATYNNLGSAWGSKGDQSKAIEYYEKSLKIVITFFGEEYPKIAVIYNNIAFAWQEKGNVDNATEYFEKAYSTFSKLYGEDNPTTKTVRKNYEDCLKKKSSS